MIVCCSKSKEVLVSTQSFRSAHKHWGCKHTIIDFWQHTFFEPWHSFITHYTNLWSPLLSFYRGSDETTVEHARQTSHKLVSLAAWAHLNYNKVRFVQSPAKQGAKDRKRTARYATHALCAIDTHFGTHVSWIENQLKLSDIGHPSTIQHTKVMLYGTEKWTK